MHNKNKMQTTDKNPTTEEIINHISGKGKSRSYEYGKLYPGRYNMAEVSPVGPDGKEIPVSLVYGQVEL